MKRYEMTVGRDRGLGSDVIEECSENGTWVTYDDHLAETKRREQALREWIEEHTRFREDDGTDHGFNEALQQLENWLDAGGLEEK